HHHRADVGGGGELDEVVDRIAGEDLHALALEDFSDGGSDFHGAGSWGWAGQRRTCYTQSAPLVQPCRWEAVMLTFYFAPGPSSMPPHIGLQEVAAPFEPRPMSFKNGDLRRPEYLALNPEGKVPTLVVDGRPLTEVAAILYYLARRFPEAGLLPKDDPVAEAQ